MGEGRRVADRMVPRGVGAPQPDASLPLFCFFAFILTHRISVMQRIKVGFRSFLSCGETFFLTIAHLFYREMKPFFSRYQAPQRLSRHLPDYVCAVFFRPLKSIIAPSFLRCVIFGVPSPNFRTIAKREVCADAPCGLIFRPALSLSPKELCNRRTKEKGISAQ